MPPTLDKGVVWRVAVFMEIASSSIFLTGRGKSREILDKFGVIRPYKTNGDYIRIIIKPVIRGFAAVVI